MDLLCRTTYIHSLFVSELRLHTYVRVRQPTKRNNKQAAGRPEAYAGVSSIPGVRLYIDITYSEYYKLKCGYGWDNLLIIKYRN